MGRALREAALLVGLVVAGLLAAIGLARVGWLSVWSLPAAAAVAFAAAAGFAAWRQVRAARRRHDHLCPSCGYALAGNVSGVCPECGTRVERVGRIDGRRPGIL